MSGGVWDPCSIIQTFKQDMFSFNIFLSQEFKETIQTNTFLSKGWISLSEIGDLKDTFAFIL